MAPKQPGVKTARRQSNSPPKQLGPKTLQRQMASAKKYQTLS